MFSSKFPRASLVAAVFVAPLMLGAECSPTERACNHPGQCVEGEELPACINFCVDRLSPADAQGMQCSTDPCDARVLSGDFILCPTPLTCFPLTDPDTGAPSATVGVCVNGGNSWLTACDPDVDLCQQGTFCRAFSDQGCGGFNRISGLHSSTDRGACVLPQREGEGCDSNWNSTDLGAPGCFPCEPGTQCRPNRFGELLCHRDCEIDDDCPCDAGEGLTGDPDTTCQDNGTCGLCMSNGASCRVREPDAEMDALCLEEPDSPACLEWVRNRPIACCNPAADCLPSTIPFDADGTRRCCVGEGLGCASDSACCAGNRCDLPLGTCQPCGRFGEEDPGGSVGEGFCCPGLVNRDGICVQPCEEVPGTVCASCQGVDSYWQCTDRGDDCPPLDLEGIEDVCNGIDDDCDGDLEEDWESPGSCSVSNADGCSGTFAGTTRCIAGAEVCVPTELCRYDCATNTFAGDGAACGWGWRRCETLSCPPSSFCLSNDCDIDGTTNQAIEQCWPYAEPIPNCPAGSPPYLAPIGCTGTICWDESSI